MTQGRILQITLTYDNSGFPICVLCDATSHIACSDTELVQLGIGLGLFIMFFILLSIFIIIDSS